MSFGSKHKNMAAIPVKVFDWASVVLASEYMDAMPTDSANKKQLLQHLASLAHVDIKWDKNNSTVLFGAWEHIVEAQVILADYLSKTKKQVLHSVKNTVLPSRTVSKIEPILYAEENSEFMSSRNKRLVKQYSTSKTTPSALLHYYRCKYLNRQVHCHPRKRRIRHMSKVKHANLRLEETDKSSEKEVYVNITLTQPAKKCSEIVSVPNNIAIPLSASDQEERSEKLPEDKMHALDSSDAGYAHNDDKLSSSAVSATHLSSCKKKRKNYEELAPYKFFCHLCSFKTKRESHYRNHQEVHKQAPQLFFCDKCDFSTIRKSYLHRHKMTHSNVKYYCNLCHYVTDQTQFLLKHKRVKHERDKKQSSSKVLSCAECSYTTTRRHLIQRHVRIHEGTDEVGQCKFQCNQCSYRASRKEHYIRHVNNVHKNRRPFLCDNCGKAFKRADALKQHSVVHARTDPPAKCVVCGKVCRSQTQLNQHLAVHSNIRSFLCEICGAAFKTRAVQRTHVLTIHKNPKAYPCTQCSRKFNTKYALRRHTKQHSEENEQQQEQQQQIESLDALTSEPVAVENVELDSDLPQTETYIIQDPVYAVGITNHQPLAVQLISFV